MRILATSSIVILGLMVTACGNEAPLNRSVESVHQPVVQRTYFVLDAMTQGGALAPGEATHIRNWFDTLNLRYGDKVSVDNSATGGTDAAMRMVAVVAGTRGLSLDAQAPITQGAVQPNYIRVVVTRTTATVPHCPDFRESVLAKFDATTSPNYGCATNASLAAMIANPEDLVKGHDAGAGNGILSTNSINGTAISTYYDKVGKSAGQVKSEGTGGQ